MKNLLISSSSGLTVDDRGLRRSRAVRSKTPSLYLRSDQIRSGHLQSFPYSDLTTEFSPVLVLFDSLVLGSSGLGRVSPSAVSVAKEDGTNSPDDATDEIMDRLVKSVTKNPSDRPSSPKARKRSRLNRKSSKYQS